MNALEQNLLNLADTLVSAAGQLVAEKNPAYSGLISLGTSLVDSINANVNPAAAPAASQISAAASAIAGGVAPVIQSVKTVGSGSQAAPAKAAALGTFLGTIETIGGDIISLFHSPKSTSAAPATVTPAPSS